MKILLLNQVFYPDIAASAQYAADLAAELARLGHDVTVVASRRAYQTPAAKFTPRQHWAGVRILRVPSTHFGKSAPWRRLLDWLSFWLSCAVRLLLLPRFDLVIAMTTPPLICVAGAALAWLRRSEFVVWVMDLNPDQAVAAGWMRAGSTSHRLLSALANFSLRSASRVVVLDRFMSARVAAKGVDPARIDIIPPWSRDTAVRFDPDGRLRFRAEHALQDKFVVMYSGNHSPCHPLGTVLDAALLLRHRQDIVFVFVGGGAEFQAVRRFAARENLDNILCLPYQSEDRLSAALSSADLHLVVMGDAFPGIVHPSKIYGILAVEAPCLYIGPDQSHVVDLAAHADIRLARHGDTPTVLRHILAAAANGYRRSGPNRLAAARYAHDQLCPPLAALLETTRPATPCPEAMESCS